MISEKRKTSVHLTIDGSPVEVEPHRTIIDAAEKIGCWIPTLCHHKAMAPEGACRICMVSVERNGIKKIMPACTTGVEEGMTVSTTDPEVVEARKVVAELLLARCPDNDDIKLLCRNLGVETSELPTLGEPTDCILCGRCVRICHEIMEVAAIDFVGRGAHRKVDTPFGTPPEICIKCGACAFVCPTGAIDRLKLWGNNPRPHLNEFEEFLKDRPNVFRPFPSAVPGAPMIDRDNCIHFKTGACGICKTVCEADAIDYDEEERIDEIQVGAVVLSTGFKTFDPTSLGELGFGRYPNVITSLQFERILSASGPTRGTVVRPSDRSHPAKIAFLQCVGSRDKRTNTYCSTFCCMQAAKEAMVAREHDERIQSTIFYMDVRAFGKGFERYRERAEKEAGVRYVRSLISSVKEDPRSGDVVLEYTDPETGKPVRESFHLLVLSVGMMPSPTGRALAAKFGIELDKHGFCRFASFTPVDSNVGGVFVTGAFTGPKDIPETVMQSSAVAGRISEYLAEARGTEIVPVTYPPERDVSGEEPRIGVFVCHCGINIAGTVNVSEVERFARNLPGVVYAQRTLFTCSQDSITNIKKMIEKHRLNRVVVASCSPRTHEPIFQDTLREAGLNPYLFEMANIREHCAWVHRSQPKDATEKAKDLVAMIVAKSRLLSPLSSSTIDVNHAGVVIGGGVAGMTAALALAGQGFPVHLVERTGSLGGHARLLADSAMGINVREKVEALIDAVTAHPDIYVHFNTIPRKLSGVTGGFRVSLNPDGIVEGGTVIIATGAREYKPETYGYGRHDAVMTQLELENKLCESGVPSGWKTVVMIQCVGSRDDRRPYCSRVCCTQAVKNAQRLKTDSPNLNIYILYRDIRTYGIYEDIYLKARENGIVFLRYNENDAPAVHAEKDHLFVSFKSPDLHETIHLQADTVILSAAVEADPENAHLADVFKVPLNEDGFFMEAHVKLRPVDFAAEGIFVAGTAHAPKTTDESIGQALAAAGRASAILGRDTLTSGTVVAVVDPEKCVACLTCVRLCPYGAPHLADSGIVEIEPVKCQGCGLCAGACPGKAIQLYHYKDDQVDALLDGLAGAMKRKQNIGAQMSADIEEKNV